MLSLGTPHYDSVLYRLKITIVLTFCVALFFLIHNFLKNLHVFVEIRSKLNFLYFACQKETREHHFDRVMFK